MKELETRKQELFAISKKAYEVIKSGFNNVKTSTEKTRGDFVTDVDVASEKIILEYLGEKFPDDSLITEESDNKAGVSGFSWIIDPLDGTNNFLRGLPFAGLQIAVLQNEKPVLGLLANLSEDVVYFAELGQGAFITDFSQKRMTIIHVSDRRLHDSMVVISSNIAQDSSGTQKKVLESVFPSAASCRVLGVAVNEFPYIANGNIEAVISNHPKSVDITAGSLLIEEAGGRVTTYQGAPWQPDMKTIIASNGLIHEDLLKLVAKSYR